MPLQPRITGLDSSTERSRTGQSSLSDTHNIDEQANASSATEVKKPKKKRRAKKKKQKKQQQQKEYELEPQQEPEQEATAVPEDTSHPLLNHPRGQEPPQVDHESDTTSTESPQRETTAIIQQSSGNDQADEAHKDLDHAPQAQLFSLGSYESATGINNPISLSLPGSSPTLKQSTTIASGSTMFTPAPQYFKKPLPSESSVSRPTKLTFSQFEAESVTDTHIETTDSAEGLAMFSRMDSDSEDLQQEGNTNYDYEREFEEDVARLTEEKAEYEDIGIDPAMAAASRQQEDLSEQNQALFMRYQHAIMKCDHMQKELAAQEKSRQNAEEAFQQQIDGLKKQLRDLKALIETLKRKEDEQRELCEEAVKKMNKYIDLATAQKKRADHCMAEVLRLQSDLEDVINMLAETKEENDTLDHQCAVLEHRYKRLAEELKQCGDQQDTTDKIYALTDEILRLTTENQTLKSFSEDHYPTSTQDSREQTPSPPQHERRPLPFCAVGVVALFAIVDVPKFAATVQKLPSLVLKLALNMGGLDFVPA
ncbi:hypothetical protein BG011_007695 [Mortierella polycephala]|uniref:Uncharacterized protein n=1 Tax=Mortierella polycephala TaxID=41804 RepID=A0A9P6QB89_9FUNG|nr:hypothetical protein BG011_007695 [Mortierella polycephala]